MNTDCQLVGNYGTPCYDLTRPGWVFEDLRVHGTNAGAD